VSFWGSTIALRAAALFITLPAEFRRKFDIHDGDLLEVVENEEGVAFRPAEMYLKKNRYLMNSKIAIENFLITLTPICRKMR
jgi:SpoVT / AbrB like domain.